MAHLRCDECGGSTPHFGSWDTPIKILCGKCSDKQSKEKRVITTRINNLIDENKTFIHNDDSIIY